MIGNHAFAGIGSAGFKACTANLNRQEAFLASAKNGERAMRGNFVQAFAVIEVVRELGGIRLVLLHDAGAEFAIVP